MKAYVIQGFYYFFRHKILWKTTALCPILWTLAFVLCAISILVPLAFIPQALMMSTIMTPFLGVPLAFLLALVELLLVVMLFSAFVLLPISDRLFDRVLELRGHGALVEEAKARNDGGYCSCCISAVSVLHLIVTFLTLPLNFVPVLGTALWLFVNGRLYTWNAHTHYHHDLKHRKLSVQRKFVRERWHAHHIFGMQAMALELVPGFNVLFVFTNCVAAALWAADMEDETLRLQEESGASSAGDGVGVGDDESNSASARPVTGSPSLSYPSEETMLQDQFNKETSYGVVLRD